MTLKMEMPQEFSIVKFDAALGADVVGIDLNAPLAAEQVEQLRNAWTEHLVLRFRGQTGLSLENQIAFSRNFGSLDKRPTVSYEMSKEHDALPAEITVISNIRSGGKPMGALGDGEAVWHADMTYNEHPPRGACLHAKEVPASGGDTHFANMYLAYDTLDAGLRARIEPLRCVHDGSRNSAGELRLGYVDNKDPRETRGAVHPLVSAHPVTGRRFLMLGRRRNAYVLGLELSESEQLLDQLWAHATQPKHAWGQKWAAGDLLMWDNVCTLHRRDSFDPSARRLMYRTQIGTIAGIGATPKH